MVEDDHVIAQMYKLRLELAGWAVEVAEDGASGLRAALSSQPDLVVLDMSMPKLDGIQVLEALRSDPSTSSLPVVVLSNSAGSGRKEAKARQLGILDWLVKAKTEPAKLAELIASYLAKSPRP